ncbi:MAG: DUF4263 domain-containing protein [Actinomycetota bacterium]|nr:DUF4263 domain-containing protein [Actinomycetota bacterium]
MARQNDPRQLIPSEDIVNQLKYRVGTDFAEPGMLSAETVVVKHGPKAYKTVSLLTFGDPETGRVSTRTFRAQTWNAHPLGPGYDFTRTANSWSCDDDEIAAIQGFINQEFAEPGEYSFLRADDATKTLLAHIGRNDLSADNVRNVIQKLADYPNLGEALADLRDSSTISSVLTRTRQSRGLKRLKTIIDDPSATEPQIQRVLQEEWWVFGGKYVSASVRRSYTVLDQFDIALIRADNSLHLVEIKQANIPGLVIPDHNHWIVGVDVHKAVNQAMNYLRSLDEQRPQIMADFGIDCRRASATVVLGHPRYVRASPTPAQLADAIRTYNSHLSRIEVITYEELTQTAERFLHLGREQVQDDEGADSTLSNRSSDQNTEPQPQDHSGVALQASDPWEHASSWEEVSHDPWADDKPPF